MCLDLCHPHVRGRLRSVLPFPFLLIGVHSTGCKIKFVKHPSITSCLSAKLAVTNAFN
jgi:hypothetical protein